MEQGLNEQVSAYDNEGHQLFSHGLYPVGTLVLRDMRRMFYAPDYVENAKNHIILQLRFD